MTKQEPTPHQQKILNAIRYLAEKHQYGPSRIEIADHLKMNRSTLDSQLQAMRHKGLVKVAHGGAGWIT